MEMLKQCEIRSLINRIVNHCQTIVDRAYSHSGIGQAVPTDALHQTSDL